MRAQVQRWLGLTALLATTGGLLLALVVAPTDSDQGPIQRLMYVHVPAAWVAFLAFGVVAVCAAGYLLSGRAWCDRAARAAAEVGVGSGGLALAVGMLWGERTWGTWWAWDPRLVSTALLLLVYAAMLALRATGTGPAAARPAAGVGLAGVVLVPVVHFSVSWWRSLHQPPTLLTSQPAPMDPRMLAALLVCLVAFTLAAAWLWTRRMATLTPTSPAYAAPVVTAPGVGGLRRVA